MKSTFSFLVAASLLLSPALCVEYPPEDYWSFLIHHTFYYRFPFDCTKLMSSNQVGQSCIPTASIILGDSVDRTSWEDLRRICQGEGTPAGAGLVKSNAMFRLVKCRLKEPNALPPNCVYKPTFETAQIIIGCEKSYPVHFENIA